MSEFKAMPDSAESASAALLKVRRLMLVTLGATFLALAVVFVIIGYRVFESGGSAAPLTLVSAALPADAKVLSTAIGEGRLAVTVAAGGATEIWMFDLKTLKATGRIRLAP